MSSSVDVPLAVAQEETQVETSPNKTVKWDPESSTTAYHRLQYVCGALALLEDLSGRMPVAYNGPEVEIPADRCFGLLKKAMDKEHETELTYREVWDFVNVLYMNIRQLQHDASPVNSAMAPDPFVVSEVDAELKQAMKGEIMTFLVRTARDFASNNPETDHTQKEHTTLGSTGFSRPDMNTNSWRLQSFQVAGRSCYKATGTNYYLYFRAGVGKWVIDDEVVPSGAAYSVSSSSNLSGIWMTSAGWKDAPWIRVVKIGNDVVVSGCKDSPDNRGASSSLLDNGTYRLQPASENVNGREHYVLKTPALQNRGEQRHLIWSSNVGCWKVTPICGEEEGSFITGQSGVADPTQGVWRCIPADISDSVRFTVVEERKANAGHTQQPHVRGRQVAVAEEEEEEADEVEEKALDDEPDQLSSLIPWNDRNHESLVFSNNTSTLAFFSANPSKLRARINPSLVKFLETNRIVVGENLHATTTDKYHKLLCALTNVKRKAEESSLLLKGRFAITGDALLKFLAIVMRIRCGIPVVLLGECGCGKTYSIKFLAAFLGIRLFVLDVHGGTTDSDVLSIVDLAERYVRESGTEAMVFLDEINACAHLGLIEEVLIQRTIYGTKRVDDRVLFLAALNPYREVPPALVQDAAGLTYDRPGSKTLTGGGGEATPFAGKNLVYLVHPVPSALVHVAFDFGALRPQEERSYIASMCQTTLEDASKDLPVVADAMTSKEISMLIIDWICAAQGYVREKERDASAASLRDAQRCLNLTVWFLKLADKRPTTAAQPYAAVANCAVLGLSFTYMFRLASRKLRTGFYEVVRMATQTVHPAFKQYRRKDVLEAVLSSTQRAFCSKFQLEPGIALNEALSENLFLSVVCILNRIPLFLVGKPGTSKTLALQIAASNLLGKGSPVPFWRKFPGLAMFTYQCSPLSTAVEIKKQFDLACRFQSHASEQVSVFVLDEVGLAEFSPSMPLKVLHSILVDPPVAVVGVSNWTLDRAKMNRAILLTRPEPSLFDLRFTGERISKSFNVSSKNAKAGGEGEEESEQKPDDSKDDSNDEWWLKGVADTFHELYAKEQQSGREFWGMRDYYALVRQLKLAKGVDKDVLITALCRNLGGKPDQMESIVMRFLYAVLPKDFPRPSTGSGAVALG